ncbi:Hypothetical protein CAP_2504 [Chondromyces apiculatus DSM 436]|uniref:Uncharacterized protein n=1 Tax=Chondromyces apiculatus DSM 436 TaxID=1192034 RepID=A0A017THD1_9BACT|nr:Hypothetical protein CAP_2504 [Chondromyces apiculatus DSM 436]
MRSRRVTRQRPTQRATHRVIHPLFPGFSGRGCAHEAISGGPV